MDKKFVEAEQCNNQRFEKFNDTMEEQNIINEVLSSVSNDQIEIIDVENISYDCQMDNDIQLEVNTIEIQIEYDEYEEIIFNSDFTSENVTEHINIISENSYLDEKNLIQIIPVIINSNYYIKYLSLLNIKSFH